MKSATKTTTTKMTMTAAKVVFVLLLAIIFITLSPSSSSSSSSSSSVWAQQLHGDYDAVGAAVLPDYDDDDDEDDADADNILDSLLDRNDNDDDDDANANDGNKDEEAEYKFTNSLIGESKIVYEKRSPKQIKKEDKEKRQDEQAEQQQKNAHERSQFRWNVGLKSALIFMILYGAYAVYDDTKNAARNCNSPTTLKRVIIRANKENTEEEKDEEKLALTLKSPTDKKKD